jgi:hypothetical protein
MDYVKDLPPVILAFLSALLGAYAIYSAKTWIVSIKDRFDNHDVLFTQNTEIMGDLKKMLAIHTQKFEYVEKEQDRQAEELIDLRKDYYLVKYQK